MIAFHTGEGLSAVSGIYGKVKRAASNISHICTDADSCCSEAFKKMGISEAHTITKAQTHLIESSNSSIRDNLARFNRKTKRYTKSLDMLAVTLDLFFNRRLVLANIF